MVNFVITMISAVAGGCIFKRMNVPAAGLVGGLIAVVLLNITTDVCYFPSEIKYCLNIGIGVFVGSTMEVSDLKSLKKMGYGSLVVLVSMVSLSMLLGFFVSKISGMDLVTSLLGTAPGGSQEMAVLAEELDANISEVVVLQLARIFITYIVLMPLIRYVSQRSAKENQELYNQRNQIKEMNKRTTIHWGLKGIIVVFNAALFGKIFDIIHFPGGVMVGALFITVVLSFLGIRLKIDKKFSFFILVTSGANIGSGISWNSIIELYKVALPILVMLVVMIFLNIFLGVLMCRFCHVDIQTAMFSCAPGGLGDMVIMATEAGVNPAEVTAIHILRILSSVTIYPWVISAFLQ